MSGAFFFLHNLNYEAVPGSRDRCSQVPCQSDRNNKVLAESSVDFKAILGHDRGYAGKA